MVIEDASKSFVYLVHLEFPNTELEIKRQIIQGTSSVRLKGKAIQQNLNLEGLLKAARYMETADEQTSKTDKQQSHAVGHGNTKTSDDREESSNGPPKLGSHNTKCGLCGGSYPHQGTFPAQGKKCMNCGKMNHFSKVCRSNPSVVRNLPVHENLRKASTVPGFRIVKDLLMTKLYPQLLLKVIAAKNTPSILAHLNPKQPNLSFKSR